MPPGGLHPETAIICAGRAGGGPLNVPIVLASNFHAGADTGQDNRADSRTDARPTREALETAVGQVEGGHSVAFSSGIAAIAAVLDLVPAGSRIVAPADCYFGVGKLLADAPRRTSGPDRHSHHSGGSRRVC
jgi:cystathionine gamma-synthase